MPVLQSEFHCMRGHVADGTQVLCPSGQVITIKSAMRGWEIRDEAGQVIETVGPDALEVTRTVLACA